jgi:hypothetical protein
VSVTALLLSALFLVMPLTGVAQHGPLPSRKSPTLTGTYILKTRGGRVGNLMVKQLSPNRIEFELDCNRGAPSYASGLARAIIDVLDGIAVYRTTEFNGPCEIKLVFKGSTVAVSQTEVGFTCGFGNGVDCGGTYRLKNRKTPKFRDR